MVAKSAETNHTFVATLTRPPRRHDGIEQSAWIDSKQRTFCSTARWVSCKEPYLKWKANGLFGTASGTSASGSGLQSVNGVLLGISGVITGATMLLT